MVLARTIFAGFLLLCAAITPARAGGPEGIEYFETHIRPLLIQNCYKCHSAESKSLKGGLRLDTRAGMLLGGESGMPAVTPGDAGHSRLIEAVRHGNPDLQMPPKQRLNDEQVKALEAWVAMGAPDSRGDAPVVAKVGTAGRRDFWSFQRPKESAVPQTALPGWAKSPVDKFILEKLAEKGLKPSRQADRRTLIRRASYDLLGLPPTAKEVDVFVADTSADAYEKLIERLLASPQYGERWGRYWLDLARYSDTKGYVYSREERNFVHAYNYRDWVIAALNADMPYDRFLMLQIAGDQVASADGARLPDDLAALGFLTVGRRFLGVVPDIIDDRIDVTLRTTMALTVGCARCHDHKFDPIPTKDYYSLYGVFSGSTEKLVCIDPSPKPTPAYEKYAKGLKDRTDKLNNTFNEKKEALLNRLRNKTGDYLAALPAAAKLHDDNFYTQLGADDLNPIFIRQWQQYVFEHGKQFDPIWAPWTALAALSEHDFAAKAPDAIGRLLADTAHPLNARVAAAFAAEKPATIAAAAQVYGKLFAGVANTWREQVKKGDATALADAEDEALRLVLYGPGSPARVPPGSIADTEWFFEEPTRVLLDTLQADVERWNINTAGAPRHALVLEDRPEQINPRVFKRGNPSTKGEEVTRHFLSLIAGENPPAFSAGSGRLELARAIASKDNPLTARVMVNRIWMHHLGSGLVSTPSDFGTRSDPPTHPQLLDWLAVKFVNEGWSIKAMHRLLMTSATYQQSSADNAAAAAVDPENRLLWRANRTRLDFEAMRDSLLSASGELDLTAGGKPADVSGNRRSVYAKMDRQFVPGVARVFDFASPDLHIPQRSATTVPQQALFFMNAPFVTARARTLAARSEIATAADDALRVQRLYRLLYQHDATDAQVAGAVQFIAAASAEKSAAPPPAAVASTWKYGYGEYDSASDRLKRFTPLPHYTGHAWQGGAAWPDAKLGWVQLTATGGHSGNDLAHAAVRRWTAPRDMAVRLEGEVRHEYAMGHGIGARLLSSRAGTLGAWKVHNSYQKMKFDRLEVKQGETIDFIVDFNGQLNSNMFTWSPSISALDAPPTKGLATEWTSAADFTGTAASIALTEPMTPWAMYVHVLLMSNEFLFVD